MTKSILGVWRVSRRFAEGYLKVSGTGQVRTDIVWSGQNRLSQDRSSQERSSQERSS